MGTFDWKASPFLRSNRRSEADWDARFFSAKIKPDSPWGVGMKKTALFKKYIFDPEIPVMPEAHRADNAGISYFPIKRRSVRMVSKRKKQLIEKAREKARNNPYHG
jgi:hypothetical protein